MVCPPGVQINFLQQDDVGLRTVEELNHPTKSQTTVNIPIYDPDGIGQKKIPAWD